MIRTHDLLLTRQSLYQAELPGHHIYKNFGNLYKFTMKEAMFYEKMKDKKVRCNLCFRHCNIPNNLAGFCRVRKNENGKLFSLVYGKIASAIIDPIQKKPFFHFAPGSETLSISTVGCVLHCQFCCNWNLSIEWEEIYGEEYTPEAIADLAAKNSQGITYTYVEPTVFYEFAYDTSKISNQKKLYNCFVTDGATNIEAIKQISKYLNAAVIDFKGSGNLNVYKKLCAVLDPQFIYDALLEYKRNKVHIEITDLIIPQYSNENDVRKLVKWIVDNLGNEVPLHFLQFFPSYKMMNMERTPIPLLEKAYEIAKKEGMKYVYLGNTPGHKLESTYCPGCGELLIERFNIYVSKFLLRKDCKCPKCGEKIPVAGKEWVPKDLWKT